MPMLLYIGYYGKNASRYSFELSLLLGFATFGYHTYKLVLQFYTVTGDNEM